MVEYGYELTSQSTRVEWRICYKDGRHFVETDRYSRFEGDMQVEFEGSVEECKEYVATLKGWAKARYRECFLLRKIK